MRGNHVRNVIRHLGPLTQLLAGARAAPVAEWSTRYEKVGPIEGIGLSTYTKFLNFLSAQVHGLEALILDDRIIRIANRSVFDELAPFRGLNQNNAVRSYPSYLTCMHSVASGLDVPAEAIEFFLFEFGLNLKPPPPK